uniref:Uncharacterized protein n=1 Tax=Candidatus Kentrum sp. SD TaxID=2126332 RepID=A0A450YI40_9GAMM|nr:MAG: hypothetical protein BECKSD772F_GA0070984_108511 [Candidatus Kentron sp. SD]VFK46295.1 MAG: hypothetical protein BECKSD772E_GA0070983_107014 [Candidatus Kentron sp. SD]
MFPSHNQRRFNTFIPFPVGYDVTKTNGRFLFLLLCINRIKEETPIPISKDTGSN